MADLTWMHTETDAAATLRDSFSAAKAQAWERLSPDARARYLRFLVVMSLQAGTMRAAFPRPAGPEGRIEYGLYHPRMYRDATSLEIASTVLRTMQLIVPPGHYMLRSLRTEDGKPPAFLPGQSTEVEVGAVPLIAWVVGAAACAVASVLIAHVTADVVDRQLIRSEDTKRLVAAQASAVQVVLNHLQREEKAGASLPYDEAELLTLESLLKTQRRIAEKRQTPLPSPFDGASRSLDRAVGGLSIGVPLAIAGGIIIFILTQK